MASNSYVCDYAKTGRSKCKFSGCKEQIEAKALRIGKSHPSGFHDGDQTDWYHAECIFDSFKRARAGTKIIESTDDIEGFSDLTKADQQKVKKYLGDGATKEKKEPAKRKKKAQEDSDSEEEAEKPAPKKAKATKEAKEKAPAKKAAAKKGSDDFSTWVIAITGTLSRKRDEVVEEIEAAGATYSKTVTKKVTHLVVADPNSNSAKIVKAKQDGVTILDENDLPF